MNYKDQQGSDAICKNQTSRPDPEDIYRMCPSKLSKHELEDLYFSLLENNLELKKTLNSQQEKLKILSTKMQRMTAAQKNTAGKDKDCCSSKVAVSNQQEMMLGLKKANERMAEKIRLLNMQLCSAKQFLKRSPLQLPKCPQCAKCSTALVSIKNPSTSAFHSKCSESSIKANSVSSQYLPKDVSQSPRLKRPVETETDLPEKESNSGNRCDENKRTFMDALGQKIINLQEELSKAHREYSKRISKLETDVSGLLKENVRVRSINIASGHALLQQEKIAEDLKEKLREAEGKTNEITLQLTLERRKVSELKSNLKLANISSKRAVTTENRNILQLEMPQADADSNSICPECCSVKQDADVAPPPEDMERINQNLLITRIAELQAQLQAMLNNAQDKSQAESDDRRRSDRSPFVAKSVAEATISPDAGEFSKQLNRQQLNDFEKRDAEMMDNDESSVVTRGKKIKQNVVCRCYKPNDFEKRDPETVPMMDNDEPSVVTRGKKKKQNVGCRCYKPNDFEERDAEKVPMMDNDESSVVTRGKKKKQNVGCRCYKQNDVLSLQKPDDPKRSTYSDDFRNPHLKPYDTLRTKQEISLARKADTENQRYPDSFAYAVKQDTVVTTSLEADAPWSSKKPKDDSIWSKSDDSGYTDLDKSYKTEDDKDVERMNKDLLKKRIMELQMQLDGMRLNVMDLKNSNVFKKYDVETMDDDDYHKPTKTTTVIEERPSVVLKNEGLQLDEKQNEIQAKDDIDMSTSVKVNESDRKNLDEDHGAKSGVPWEDLFAASSVKGEENTDATYNQHIITEPIHSIYPGKNENKDTMKTFTPNKSSISKETDKKASFDEKFVTINKTSNLAIERVGYEVDEPTTDTNETVPKIMQSGKEIQDYKNKIVEIQEEPLETGETSHTTDDNFDFYRDRTSADHETESVKTDSKHRRLIKEDSGGYSEDNARLENEAAELANSKKDFAVSYLSNATLGPPDYGPYSSNTLKKMPLDTIFDNDDNGVQVLEKQLATTPSASHVSANYTAAVVPPASHDSATYTAPVVPSARRDSATYTADMGPLARVDSATYTQSEAHTQHSDTHIDPRYDHKFARVTSPENTDHEISSLSDLPPERDGKYHRDVKSPGEEKATFTDYTLSSRTTDYGSLSDGELPITPRTGRPRTLSFGEKTTFFEPVPTTNRSSSAQMEATLDAIGEELAHCRMLLASTRNQEAGAKGPEIEHKLHRANGAQKLPDTQTHNAVFTLHIGTIVLSDEAVLSSRDKSLILTWKFYDQSVAMTRLRPGRVVLVDFNTEYDVPYNQDFINYMKQEEMPLVICEINKQDEPFATCSMPLRDPLLHTNRRADMSLALVAGPAMTVQRGSDSLVPCDELGVLDLWCMLRSDVGLKQATESVGPRGLVYNQYDLHEYTTGSMYKSNLLNRDEQLLRSSARMKAQAVEDERTEALQNLALIDGRGKTAHQSRFESQSKHYPIYTPPSSPDWNLDQGTSTSRSKDATKNLSVKHRLQKILRSSKQDSASRLGPDNVKELLKKQGVLGAPRYSFLTMGRRKSSKNWTDPTVSKNDKIAGINSLVLLPLVDASKKTVKYHDKADEPTSLKETVKQENAEENQEPSIDITVLWLTLNGESDATVHPGVPVPGVYVAYSFLGRHGADLETPVSLPRPKHYSDKLYFNFKKTFHLHDADLPLLGHMSRCRAPRAPHAPHAPADHRDCIIFSVVSEPPEDPLGLSSCEDIGYAYLYLGDILAHGTHSAGRTETVAVRAARAGGAAGALAVRVDGLPVLRRCRDLTNTPKGPGAVDKW